jgi:hypothetical protein
MYYGRTANDPINTYYLTYYKFKIQFWPITCFY